MAAEVTLRIVGGTEAASEVAVTDRVLVVAGRAADCRLRLEHDRLVSRHHCLFDLNPPYARVRDFGSLNGTFLNGGKIGQRDPGLSPEEGRERGVFAAHDLHDGDQVRIGRTILRVEISAPARPPPRPSAAASSDPRTELERIGRHDIVRELSRGGMGAVFLARDTATGERVAVKVMLPEVAASADGSARFLREIENTRALRHPNVVAVRDAGSSAGTLFLTLEYCDGGSVHDALEARGGTLPVDEAVGICLQALDGLAHAHEAVVPRVELADGNVEAGRGVVHRDLKPHNILLAGESAKISDFGLSKALDKAGLTRNTRTGMVAGTPVFMARKQLVDYRYAGPEVDVWSLAACLYFMLTGRPPRDFAAGMDPFLAVLEHDAVPVRRRDPALPVPLADVIDHALAERPEIGFTAAGELKHALQRAL